MEKERIPDSTRDKLSFIARGVTVAEGVSQLLNATLDAPDYPETLRDFPEKQKYIDGLHQIVCNLPLHSVDHKRSLRALRKAGGAAGLLPTCYSISFSLKKQTDIPATFGGFSDVWKVQNPDGSVFALKDIRMNGEGDLVQLRKKFCKEVAIAKQVPHHDNIMPIVGVQMTRVELGIVSEWLEHGHMLGYLNKNTTTNRVDILLGVARGLHHLHFIDVVHGDLKSLNVLIDSHGRPRLTDFGLSSITMNETSVNASTPGSKGTHRWLAPELLLLSMKKNAQTKAPSVRPTKESDTYSFAMVVTEIFTGKHPFYPSDDNHVTLLLAKGSRPDRPDHEQFTSKIWTITRKCWEQNPKKRPGIGEVLKELTPDDDESSLVVAKRTGRERFGSFRASLGAFLEPRVSFHLRRD